MPSFCDDGYDYLDHHGDHDDVDAAFDSDVAENGGTVPSNNHRAPVIGDYSVRDAFDAADEPMLIRFDGSSPHFYCTQIVCNAFGHIL